MEILNTELRTQLENILLMSAPLDVRLTAWANLLRGVNRTEWPRYLASELVSVITTIEAFVRGDSQGLHDQLRYMVTLGKEEADRPHVAFNIVETNDGLRPGLVVYRVDRRTLEAQEILRSPQFLQHTAARMGESDFPAEAAQARIQGAVVLESAGFVRYSWFTDFLPGVDRSNAALDGGILFNHFADDLLEADAATIEALFPEIAAWGREQGLWNREYLRFASNIYFTIHDSLGHLLPYPMNHPVKQRVGFFLRGGMEELIADLHSLWAGVAPSVQPFLARVFPDPREHAFFPQVVLLKRLCSYLPRGIQQDSASGDLMQDHDARASLLLYRALVTHGAIEENLFGKLNFCRACLPHAINMLLDDCLVVERSAGLGAERYALALAKFATQYQVPTAPNGDWMFPEAIRTLLT